MDNPYYGQKNPPSLVTVENGFTFADDSDLSSLNTTPRKQEARKSLVTRRRRLDEDEIEQADLSLQLSRANRNNPIRRSNENPPPLQVVQVAASDRRDGGDGDYVHDCRVAREEENILPRGQSRDEKLRDRKEKYRRMASPSSRRVGRASSGVLNSWKKKADQRLQQEQEKKRPWFVPVEAPDDEKEHEANHEQDDDDDDDVSPMKATKHTFEDVKEEEEEEESPIKEVNAPPEPVMSPVTTASEEKKQPEENSIVSASKDTFVSREPSPPLVDMYGCPIFRVDDDEEELENTRAKLDQLDVEVQEKEQEDSIKSMLSSASFFSKTAAQTLADPSAGITKFIGDAAQGVEALVLGPLEEGDEDLHEEEDVSSQESTPPPPPARRARGRSPTAAMDAYTNSAALRRRQQQHEEATVEHSFVLDDKSDVDVPATLNVTPQYVLSDLQTMEKANAASITSTADLMAIASTDDSEEVVVPLETSSENEIYVEDTKWHRVASIDEEVDAAVEVMDAIHVKDEVERLEALHAAEAAARLRAGSPPMIMASASEETELIQNTCTDDTAKEPEKSEIAAPEDEVSDLVIRQDESSEVVTPHEASDADVPVDEVSDVAIAEEKETSEVVSPSEQFDADAPEGDAPVTPEKSSAVHEAHDETTKDVDEPVEEEQSEQNGVDAGAVGAAVLAGAVGAAVVTVAVSPDKEEIERDPGQLVIAVAEDSESEEPEFPPTDDADVDRIDFDTVSVKSAGSAPVLTNRKDSKELAKDEVAKKDAVKTTKAQEDPVPPESAPETPKEKDVKKKVKKNGGSVRSKRASPKVASRKDASTGSSKDSASSKPAMVKTLDDNNGIAKGDIVLSLLNTNLSEANRAPKGADQVRDAILRMRDMRKRQDKVELPEYVPDESGTAADIPNDSPSKRSSLPVDVDDMHVVGASNHVKTLEEDAIQHLKHDEIEAALELYEEIITIYADAFKETAKRRKKKEKNDHKAYIGAALHNIGILHLLRFDFEEALSFFEKAAENRMEHFGEGSVDHLASLCKIALCFYAMDEYVTAHKSLENVLELSKNHLAGLTDFMQVAEILNNLGCLSFMCGQSASAMTMFKECLEIQTAVLKQSLYSGPRFAGQSTSLNISVTRSNIGYVQMLTKNAGPAIVEFEASLMHQQMILADGHNTVVCTMDHLAVANLLAKNKEEAIKMLGRMLRAQLAAYGPLDERCILTLSKLQLVQMEQTDYLEKALEQLWDEHSKSASPKSKAAQVASSKKSNKMLKKLSFRKKVAKLS